MAPIGRGLTRFVRMTTGQCEFEASANCGQTRSRRGPAGKAMNEITSEFWSTFRVQSVDSTCR